MASHSIGNRHPRATGMVSLNADGVLGTTTVPLLLRLFKPDPRLKAGDVSKPKPKPKPQLASEIS